MHDLLASQDIKEAVLKEAKKNNLTRVTKITIDFGQFEDHGETVLEDNISFHLEHLLKGTVADKAKLVFNKVKSDNIVLSEIEGE